MLNHYEYAAIDNDNIVEERGSKKHCFNCKLARRRFDFQTAFVALSTVEWRYKRKSIFLFSKQKAGVVEDL